MKSENLSHCQCFSSILQRTESALKSPWFAVSLVVAGLAAERFIIWGPYSSIGHMNILVSLGDRGCVAVAVCGRLAAMAGLLRLAHIFIPFP